MKKPTIGYDTFAFRMQVYGGITTMFESILVNLTSVEPTFVEEIPQSWQKRLSFMHQKKHSWQKAFIERILRRISVQVSPRNIDIIHLTYYKKMSTLTSKVKPLAITVCDFIPERFPNQFTANPHLDKIELIREADLVFCISQSTADDLNQFVPDYVGKIVVTPLASKFPINSSEAKSDFDNLGLSKPYLLYVGRRDRYKNTDIILKFLRIHSKFELVLFGGEALSSEEEFLLGEDGINRTHCVNGDDSLLQQLYVGANCLVFPSLWEGFGLPILEALSLGCPVVCSEITVFRELFGDAVTYFEPTSIDSLIEAHSSLNEQDNHRLRKQEIGYEVNENYSWSKTAQITQEAYLDLLKDR
jgi:glycosyltransferase involved in cell wall biosynthesis